MQLATTTASQTTTPAGLRADGWLTLPEAARRGGYAAVGSLRHRLGEWLPIGLARQYKPPRGKQIWQVHETADPRFARCKFPEQLPFDMSSLDAAHRAVIVDRERLLKEWDTALSARPPHQDVTSATREFCQIAREIDGKRVSRTSLYRWRDAYRAEGRAGLQDDRKLSAPAGSGEYEPFYAQVRQLWLTLRRPKLKTVYDHVCLIAPREGWPIPHFKRVQRMQAKIDPRVVVKMRLGDKAFDEQVVPPIRRDYSTLASNDTWCADHHQLDVIVKGPDGKHCRPWLTPWMDLRSRKVVGYHLYCHDPNADAILLAFRDAAHPEHGDHGVPERVYVDNGKDFDSFALQGQTKFERRTVRVEFDPRAVGGLFGNLGCDVMHAQPYNAKAKPIERFFHTVKVRFSMMGWPTYCGGTTLEKPADLAEQLARGAAPTFADLAAAFATWLDADYHARAHEGDGVTDAAGAPTTPEVAWAAHLATKRTCRAADLELLLQRTTKPATVGNQGVPCQGRHYGKGDPALDRYFGQKVYLRIDPADIRRASAWTTDDKLIGFLAVDRGLSWHATEQDYREAMGLKKRVRNSVKAVQELGPRRTYDTIDFMRERRAAELRGGTGVPARDGSGTGVPPVIQPIRTPLEGQLDALQEARKPLALRLAAGGECGAGVSPAFPEPLARRSLLHHDFDADDALPTPRAAGGSILSLAERLAD